MKTLLVALFPDDDHAAILDAVAAVAETQKAHVIGYMPIPGPTYIPVATPEVVIPMDDSMKRRFEALRPDIRDAFAKRMDAAGLSNDFVSDEPGGQDLMFGVAGHGRTVDMIVMPMHASDGEIEARDAGEIASLVMAAGRPVLVLPPDLEPGYTLDVALVAWNGSREAARAAYDAVPVLKDATETDVVWIDPGGTLLGEADAPGAEIGNVLARHGINVNVRALNSATTAEDTLMEAVRGRAADLLVLGAYGRSRLRERILGGMTEHVLRRMPCPVLLSN